MLCFCVLAEIRSYPVARVELESVLEISRTLPAHQSISLPDLRMPFVLATCPQSSQT